FHVVPAEGCINILPQGYGPIIKHFPLLSNPALSLPSSLKDVGRNLAGGRYFAKRAPPPAFFFHRNDNRFRPWATADLQPERRNNTNRDFRLFPRAQTVLSCMGENYAHSRQKPNLGNRRWSKAWGEHKGPPLARVLDHRHRLSQPRTR